MGISIPPFPAPSHSWGSAQSHLARAGAMLPQNAVAKETSLLFRSSGENLIGMLILELNLSKTRLL